MRRYDQGASTPDIQSRRFAVAVNAADLGNIENNAAHFMTGPWFSR